MFVYVLTLGIFQLALLRYAKENVAWRIRSKSEKSLLPKMAELM